MGPSGSVLERKGYGFQIGFSAGCGKDIFKLG